MDIDVAYGETLSDAVQPYHNLSVEGRSPDDQESSTSNLLVSYLEFLKYFMSPVTLFI